MWAFSRINCSVRRCVLINLRSSIQLTLRYHRTLATSFFNPPSRIPFAKIVLVDPPIWSKNVEEMHTELFNMTEAVTPIRRDIWENLDHARQWLRRRLPGGSWDDRVFDAQIVSFKYKSVSAKPNSDHLSRNMVFAHCRLLFIQTNQVSP